MAISVKVFTHTDLDGMGCSIVGQVVFGAGNTDVTYCNYEDVNEKVEKFLDNHNFTRYDIVFITDISVNEEVAEKIDKLCGEKMVLLDHHATATSLNKYGWANVSVMEADPFEDGEQKTSGTSMFYKWCRDSGLYFKDEDTTPLEGFVEAVRMYDTWEWKTRFNVEYPKVLNDLFTLQGRYIFVKRWVENQSLMFNKTEQTLLEVEKQRRERYLRNATKSMREKITPEGYKVGIVFAEQYQSELGNKLAEENLHLDFIIMINLATANFSYRSTKHNINLGKDVAQPRGGGGHAAAAGAPINSDLIEKIVQSLLEGKW